MKRSESSMQIQRSWLVSLVVACLLSCLTAATLCVVTVVVHQSAIKTAGSALHRHETRIRLLERQNTDLHVMFEKTQARLYTLEQAVFHTSDQKVFNPNNPSTRDSQNRHVPSSVDNAGSDEGEAKGDEGILDESDMHFHVEQAQQEHQYDVIAKPRLIRSPGRNREKSHRRECVKRCKRGEKGDAGLVSNVGEKGQRGETGEKGGTGPTSYVGEKGRRGEKGRAGERGPAGECRCPTTTAATTNQSTSTPVTTQSTGVPHWSDVRRAALLAAHFEGGRLATINTGERRDPFNRGYVDLSEINGGWVPYWRYAQWMNTETRLKFVLDYRGNVTVTDGGIYYVYSQMLYYDPSVFMGHSLYIGGQRRFSCTECTVDRDRKFNTCYIGGLVEINPGDSIGIKVSYANRVINLNPDSTHFGLIRLS